MSSGASIVQETLPHTVNVVIHVGFGTLALILGLIPLLARKGGRQHIRFGRWFLACITVVIMTAVIGIFAFGFRAFLGVITLLAAYEAYSGFRALRIRFTGPRTVDTVVSVLALGAAALFIFPLRSIHLSWSPAIIYPTLGTLVAVAIYDLARLAFPKSWFATTWFYEHLVKMIGAYTAVVSAFSGTVLEGWQPWSQIAPSILGTAAMLGFIVYYQSRKRRGVPFELGNGVGIREPRRPRTLR